MSESEQRIQMQDESQDGSKDSKQEGTASTGGGGGGDALDLSSLQDPPPPRSGDAMLGSYGNSAGDKIQSGLSPVGKPLGKGLETVGKPIGGLVEPLVGGLMKSGGGFGAAAGVGAGNMDHKNAEEEAEKKRPVGGEEQTADNPLGLSGEGGS